MELRPWQRAVLKRALEVDSDGRLVWSTCVVSTPRQQGKSWMIQAVSVARAKFVMPVPTPGYPGRVPAVRTSVPGLYTLGSAQITVGTLNVEQTLQLLDEGWDQLDHGPVALSTDGDEKIDQEVA